MDRLDENRTRLAQVLDQVAVREGTHPTLVPGVEVTRRSHGFPRKPVAYQPNIIVVGQGRKQGYLGDEVARRGAAFRAWSRPCRSRSWGRG